VTFEEGALRYDGPPPDVAALSAAWQAQRS
jgi:hypothetical protein